VLAWLALGVSSCAFYNTYYLARRYYTTATAGLPYAVEKTTGAQAGNYQKSIDYSKKVIAKYPKSKWVDDAYLMWAQALLGKEDPLQTVSMLQDFPTRYPESPRRNEATFYLGVAQRQARKYTDALVALDEYLQKEPKGELAPYAHLERSRALMSLNRPTEAAEAATQVIEKFPGSPLVVRVRAARAEALLAAGDPLAARRDFQALGLRAVDDNERFTFLLREADCLEAARDHVAGLELLSSALAHEEPPVRSPTGVPLASPGGDRYGQLTLRIGTIHMLAGRPQQALTAYRNVLQDYPKTALGAEAQYRIGYTYETVLDDFETARQEYAKVRDQSVGSAFFTQATQRQQSLERLAKVRGAGADSSDRKVEGGFLLAEQYLFQLDKPERALDAYAEIARDHPGTPAAGKALNAQAWVLRHKLVRTAAADSLLWKVVHEYPGTEAQIAARDYLESAGETVPTDLIKLPEPEVAPPDTTTRLSAPPQGPMPIGPSMPRFVPSPSADSLGVVRPPVAVGSTSPLSPLRPEGPDSASIAPPHASPPGFGVGRPGSLGHRDSLAPRPDTTRRIPPLVAPHMPADTTLRALADSTRRRTGLTPRLAPADSIRRAAADTTRRASGAPTRRAPADTTRRASADTTHHAPADTTKPAPPRRRWVPPDSVQRSPR
jgi:TolA-binding protein